MDMIGVSDHGRCVMVGDSDNDAVGASEIGMPFLGVTYGFGFSDDSDVNEYPNIGSASSPEDIAGCVL